MCLFDLLSISRIAKTNHAILPKYLGKRKERLFLFEMFGKQSYTTVLGWYDYLHSFTEYWTSMWLCQGKKAKEDLRESMNQIVLFLGQCEG